MDRRTLTAAALSLFLIAAGATFLSVAAPTAGAGTDPNAEALKTLNKLKASVTMSKEGDTVYFSVSFFGSNAKDEDVKVLAGLKPLRSVALGQQNTDAAVDELAKVGDFTILLLRNTKITVQGVKKLAGFTKLTELGLYGDVTADWLKETANVPNLQTLRVGSSQLTKDGLNRLADIKNLRRLDLDCSFDDSALKNLSGCMSLEALAVYNLFIPGDGAGVKDLAGLPNLTDLFLTSIQFKDVHVNLLKSLKQVRKLGLGSIVVTDAAVPDLSQLTWLESLDLFGANITKAGVEKLRLALPKCKIQGGQ